ncbi:MULTISPECIES: hypothetical protein [Streptosporangium]|uniref:Uncharacterized protein n=1 Tax=Streptosporangium brasiliense TaxID=47480 RepID=A0ABT9R2K7_9ACTN|nr:hypothetical protein [Streptosporangium brasiliense]MDP9863460.1 hypothetical protein [Streptosporangium brasiliense]
MPRRFSDVRDVQPLAMLSKHEVLLADPDERRPVLVRYDRRTGKHKILATVPEGARYHWIQNVTVSDSHIVWIAAVRRPDRTTAGLELWTVPIAGGQVRSVAPVSPKPVGISTHSGQEYRLEIVGDQIVWWDDNGGPVHGVPLAGGTPTLLGSGYISTWPWVHDGEETVTNLITKEKRTAEDVDGIDRRCGPEWCVSGADIGNYELTQVIVQRRDGSARRTVPGQFRREPLLHERFGFFDPPQVSGGGLIGFAGRHVGSLGDASVIYDRCTGKTAVLRPKRDEPAERGPESIRVGGSTSGGPLLFWRNDAHKQYMAMDLAAISGQGC